MKGFRGFSILESLCALLVLNLLGVGLLQWQWQALQAQRDVLAFQNALGLAQDLWQRMQANPTAGLAYQLALDQVAQGPNCQAQPCNATQWAQADLAEWQRELQLRIPGAKALLATQLTNPSTASLPANVSLTVVWPSRASSSTSPANQACPEQHRCWQTTWAL